MSDPTSLATIADSDLTSEELTLIARIPELSGSSKKAAYLAYRSTGFTVSQSCELANVSRQLLTHWRKKDVTFKKVEDNHLARLQSTVGNDVIKFEFLRNMRLLLKNDMNIIVKGINDTNNLTPREYELFKQLRKFYTPQDMLALEKIINPGKHKDGPVTINLTWGSRNNNQLPDIEADFTLLDAAED